jgi:two-component system cell cycle response regulator DivK
MDVQLPGGLSGLDVTRSLKDDDILKAIPVIAVTAFAMKGDDKKILDAGCDAYMPKPISAMKFLESIKGFLN